MKREIKKEKNNILRRAVSFPISVGIVPDILLFFKNLGLKKKENEKTIPKRDKK